MCSAASAQRMLGVSTGSWSGTTSLSLNPANVADSRHRFVVDLFSVNAGVDNDGAALNPSDALRSLTSTDSTSLASIFKFKEGSNFNLMAPYAEARGPGALVSLGRHGIALTTRLRAFNQFTDFDQRLYRTVLDADYRNISDDYSLQSGRFGWNVHLWSDIGLTYGAVLLEQGHHFLKAGVTGHYLGGIGYVNFRGNSLDGRYYSQQDSIRINNSEASFASNIISNDQQLSQGISGSVISDYFFGNKGGRGFGFDLGLVYEFRPHPEGTRYNMDGRKGLYDRSEPSYKLRLSAAVTDLGLIRYRERNYQAALSGAASFKGSELAGKFNSFKEFQEYAKSKGLNVSYDSGGFTTVRLPASLVLGADYRISRRFAANLTYIGNMVDRQEIGNYYYSQITLTPRYDSRLVSIGLPITYGTFTNQLKLGIGARVSGFFAGSDDALALLGSKNQNGINFYFGAFVPVNRHRPRDRDRDGVSDRYDRCPKRKGSWENRGCPEVDTDCDGVPDADDACPDTPGSITLNGCPDSDGDSVADAEDRCPSVPGLVDLQGCPDGDEDGVADDLDDCPEKAGPTSAHGCPDTDKDGVPDNTDRCPTLKGPAALRGCPDGDHDGTPDIDDRCPKVPGSRDNNGCPPVRQEIRKRLEFAATAIQFQTGKATIKPASNAILNEVAAILREYSDYYMTLEGYTDNVGSPAKNLQLSKDRAAAVKSALIIRGISADRLVSNGYGEANPVAPNTTAAGRAKNRRVVLDLKQR